MSKAYSIGLRSGDIAGQSTDSTGAVCRYSLVPRALLPFKVKSGPIAPGNIHIQDLVDGSFSCHCAFLNDIQNGRGYQHIRVLNARWTISVPDSSISEVHAKSGFVSKQYWGPIIQRPSDLSAHPLETCFDVVSRQWNADC